MARTRISTTVDAELLETARRTLSGATNAVLVDAALAALLAEHPLDEPDDWGDLASFRRAAAAS